MNKHSRIQTVVDFSVSNYMNEAEELTQDVFCIDCPNKHAGCYPCPVSRSMNAQFLSEVIAKYAWLN
jgi:hypothetical protein